MAQSANICTNLSKDMRKIQKYMIKIVKLVGKIGNEAVTEQQLESVGSTSIFKDPIVQATTTVAKGHRLLRQAEKNKKQKGCC